MRLTRYALLAFVLGWTAAGCGQDDIELPEQSAGGGQCGSWYPRGDDADAGVQYAIQEGEVFPCLVWESARQSGVDTYINVGDLFLRASHDQVQAKALVIVVSAMGCLSCEEVIGAMASHKEQLKQNAVMVGVARAELLDPTVQLTLDQAEDVLLILDHWPADWVLTNDLEHHLPDSVDSGTPYIIVVRLADMQVISFSNDMYSASTIGNLVSDIENL